MHESPHPILLDISRTVARSRLPAPTGIDRVERAYVRWAMDREAKFLAAFDGRQYLLGSDAVGALLDWLDGDAEAPGTDLRALLKPNRDAKLKATQSLVRKCALASSRPDRLGNLLQNHMPAGHYLNVGHDNLTSDVMLAMQAAGLSRSALIHDTIPLDHPEFARTGTPEIFKRKLDAAFLADLLIANSNHTAGRLKALGAKSPIATAPLGIEPKAGITNSPAHPAMFVCLGTIEPRKNHALLLSIWQQFWQEMGDASPRLVLIGRRGWENDAVFQILDTHPMMGQTVIEAGTPDDTALVSHFATATALLFPSHAEGYGLPLAEALDAGLPCIASDLPALREVGGETPEYLPPNDVTGWNQAILDHANADHARRTAQLERLKHWRRPTWGTHFDIVENALETILVQTGKDG